MCMLLGHLIGGNEVKGFAIGKVFVDDEELSVSYEELAGVCGNISLGDLDTGMSIEYIEREYIRLVEDVSDFLPVGVSPRDFVIDNHLTKKVSYSTYELDAENQSLVLKVDIYE